MVELALSKDSRLHSYQILRKTKQFTISLNSSLSLILLFLSLLGSISSAGLSADNCTPGFLVCEYYGCQEVTECPPVCEAISEQNTCTKKYNGVSCLWENGLCSRDVECSSTPSGCSEGCMYCNTFDCLPKSSRCPIACALHANEKQCSQAPKYGSIFCNWSNGRCTTVDASKGNSTLTSKTEKNSTDSKPAAPEPDFAGIKAKKSWVGIAGIIIGVIFGLLGIAGIIILIWHRRRERMRRLQSDANLHSTHTTLYRPRSFIHALRSVVDNNAKELEAVAPLSPLPSAQSHT
ncbi:hypothetical protein DSO57_1014427 [Entomophthora muscae]|uniref:Uncharacterized protein n=1 Tax=Entomophthora muscae TaxID=34485 RepID=A0ACC2UR86_9FUNG|nr:hypothetical protein DSO57_1014427 [Entomophthora muscae]